MAYIHKRMSKTGQPSWSVIYETGKTRHPSGKVTRTRARETFDTARAANDRLAEILNRKPSSSQPFRVLAKHFLDHVEKLKDKGERERSTFEQLKQHINLHILADADFAAMKCRAIGTAEAQAFLDTLIDRVSPKMATKVRGTLGRVFAHGARRGFTNANPVTSTKLERRTRPDAGAAEHIQLPPKEDLRALIAAARAHDETGRAAAVIHTLMFTGLRISELRGLKRSSCTLVGATPKAAINQRADRFGAIGPVKGRKALRTMDLGPETAQCLRVWVVKAPAGELLFANEEGGGVWSYANFWNRFWVPLMNRAGLVTGEDASATVREWSAAQATFKQPRFAPHMLRHVYASLQIEQGVKPKRLQLLMGHSTLRITLDTYGHLWPDEDADRDRAKNVETAL